jgi:hypothetical protein
MEQAGLCPVLHVKPMLPLKVTWQPLPGHPVNPEIVP